MTAKWRIVAVALFLAFSPGCWLFTDSSNSTCSSDPTGPGCVDEQSVSGSASLPITPIAQQTDVWCWAATAEMVFRAYGLPSVNAFGNYQCGIVAAYFGGQCTINCGLCVAPIGGMDQLQVVIDNYGLVARQLGLPSPVLTSDLLFRPLTIREVKTEIDARRPIVAGISAGGFPFPNFSQHVVLVVGYDANGAEPALIVNDPFPYDMPVYLLAGQPNPYTAHGAQQLQPGRYKISLKTFISSLVWANTIYGIRSY